MILVSPYLSVLRAGPNLNISVLNVISYPLAIVNTFVSLGLIWLYTHRQEYNWYPPFRATLPVVIFFFLSNVYLVIAPFVPPETPEQNIYDTLPYWLHCVIGIGIILAGGVYWVFWAVVLPKLGGYRLEKQSITSQDGWSRNVFVHVPLKDFKETDSEEVPHRI